MTMILSHQTPCLVALIPSPDLSPYSNPKQSSLSNPPITYSHGLLQLKFPSGEWQQPPVLGFGLVVGFGEGEPSLLFLHFLLQSFSSE